ncbi:ABC transporter permease [Micromonosporaceae bacterium Da 78-11]
MLLETYPESAVDSGSPVGPRSGPRESLYRINAVVRHNVILRLRDPGQMISYLVLPMILMLFLKPLYERAVEGGAVQVVTGLLVMFSVFAIAIVGSSILVERQWMTWDRLRQTRATTAELLIGKIIPLYVIMLVQQSVLLVYGCLVIGIPMPRSVGLVAIAIGVWAFCLVAIGALLATVARSLGELGVISDVGAITLSSLGGSLVPISIMPGWAQGAAHVSPGYWALTMMQAAVRGDLNGVLLPAGVLLAVGLVAGAFAIRRLTRGWGRARLL